MTVAVEVELPEAFADLFKPARYKGWFGGRGGAKSTSFATALLILGTRKPIRVLCCREMMNSIKESVKLLLDDQIRAMELGNVYSSIENEIRGVNGTLFVFRGLRTNPQGITSLEGIDIAWVEEATTVSQTSLELLIPTIRKEGSELWFSWNPRHANDPVDVLLRGEPPPNSIVRQVNYDGNPWFPEVLRAEMEWDRSRDPDKYSHVWLGEYIRNSEARVFRNWRIDSLEVPKEARPYYGADWGFATDPTALVRCWLWERTLYIDREVYRVGCEIDHLPALFAGDDKQSPARWTNPHGWTGVDGAAEWPITADSARPETISYMQHRGFRVAAARKGPGSLEDGIEFLKSYDIVVHPDCKNAINEFTLYSYKTDRLTDEVLPELEDRENHCIAEGELVVCERGLVPIELVLRSDRVLTRAGYKPVLFAGQTDTNRETVLVATTEGNVRCTPDHKIWTTKGFVRADALRYGDEVLGFGETPWSCCTSNGMGGGIADTLKASVGQIAAIFSERVRGAATFCIETFGSLITGQSRPDFISTTSTAIHSTTASTIWPVFHQRITLPSIHGMTSEGLRSLLSWIVSARSPKRGTPARKAWPNIAKLVPWLSRISSLSLNGASNATGHFSPVGSETSIGSAQTRASPHGAALPASTTKNGFAPSVGPSFSRTSTTRARLVPGHVLTVSAAGQCERVYDLTVEDQHEFFVGGLLVSNCIDAARYAIEGVRRAMIYAEPVELFTEEQPRIASHWRRVAAIEMDRHRFVALWGAWDRAGDVLHLYAEYVAPVTALPIHADALKQRKAWIPVLFDMEAKGRSKDEGARVAYRLSDLGVQLFNVPLDVDGGIADVTTRLGSGRIKVASNLTNWLTEYRRYRRDEKDQVAKDADDLLMRATAQIVTSGLQVAVTENQAASDEEGFDMGDRTRSKVTGY